MADLLDPAPPRVLMVGHFDSDGHRFFHKALLPLKLEGLLAKWATSPYTPRRKGAVPPERFRRR